MEKLKTFISLFVYLSDAGRSVSGIRLPEQYQSAIKKRIGNLVSDFENDRISITEVIEEIESSISHTNNPKAVILRVLRKFQDISPYLLINLKKEYSIKNDEEVLKIGNATYYKSYVLSHKTLERYCAWIQPLLDYTDANIYEKYLIQSFLSFVDFFNAFDMLCLDYEFDVIKIQEENGIIVWVRDISLLTANGYHAKVKPIKSFPYQFPEQRERDIEPLLPQPIVKQKPIKYGANEYALTYIFDLYAIGRQVPTNRVEGSFDAKKIKQDASIFPNYDKAPDTFYRAVKFVLKYDLNKPTDLQNISKDWLNAVRNLSNNWVTTEQYLKNKRLIEE
jgi:hypothetical protein